MFRISLPYYETKERLRLASKILEILCKPLIKICSKYITSEIKPNNLNSFKSLGLAFSSELKKCLNNKPIPYGRYLLTNQNDFNIQMDVFSNNYTGSIHSHGTWGMFGIVSLELYKLMIGLKIIMILSFLEVQFYSLAV